ncbi:hypothetical protein [Psychrobacillus sp. FSL K6-1415]|uniref:hypothetical protein n=1 Tax=Psychrobacillus sp. FSL K6-1415 TaxID=2921544 RepID=UPI0030FB057B
MTYFHIGSINVPAVWLAVFVALGLSSILSRGIVGNKIGEWYWNGASLYFLVWKISYILFNFELFMETPLSLIFFNGGTKGHFLALAILSVYLLFIAYKKHPHINEGAPQIILLYFFNYEVVINLLEKNITETIVHFIVLAGYLVILVMLKKRRIEFFNQILLLLIVMELLILSIFQSIFEREPFTFLWMGIITLLISRKIEGG